MRAIAAGEGPTRWLIALGYAGWGSGQLDEEMRRLITSREIYPIYDKWFNKPIPPNNTVLNLPVSYLLRDFWKYPTDQVPF